MWALRDGINLTIQLSCQQLEVELDAKVIMDLINSNSVPNRAYSLLLHDYRKLLAKIPRVRVTHMFREANKCADLLAKRDCSMQDKFTIFETPPCKISFFASLEYVWCLFL